MFYPKKYVNLFSETAAKAHLRLFAGRNLLSLRSTPLEKMVIGLNVRRNQPQSSNVGLKVRSSNEPSRLYCSGSGRYEAMNGNLYCVFSTEKYFVIRKRGRQVEVVSKFHPNFFGLNVRRNGPPPSICVRSFSPITRKVVVSAKSGQILG
jgi:hypothetical protein